MKQVSSIGYFAGLTMVAGVLMTGSSPAQSLTNTPGAVSVSPPFTNTTMEKFQKPSEAELKKNLTRAQFEVTQHAATEPSFQNEFWNNHKPGIYVDIVSGQPLSPRACFQRWTGANSSGYCINSASLRFVPLAEMEKTGYAAQLEPFIKAGLYKPKADEKKAVEALKR